MTIKGQINLELKIKYEKYSLRELKSVSKNEGRISSMLPSLNIGSLMPFHFKLKIDLPCFLVQ